MRTQRYKALLEQTKKKKNGGDITEEPQKFKLDKAEFDTADYHLAQLRAGGPVATGTTPHQTKEKNTFIHLANNIGKALMKEGAQRQDFLLDLLDHANNAGMVWEATEHHSREH